jgi:2',3'-cyclic-nucleotide 2'-phosphodiesterase (5'-nucleotidase family)
MALDRGPRLRLVCVNDVYTLENLPRLRSLVQAYATEDPADLMLVTLAGDFVGPSMLSSLDSGRGMIDCMNAVPITHVIFGNHEDDLPVAELRARIGELKAVWISTNVLGFDPRLPTSSIVEVKHDGGRTVRVGLVGVVMEDPTAYRAPPFGGATVLPASATAIAAGRHLVEEEGCAIAIPITHQSIAADRALAAELASTRFPVIVGGHEHVPFVEKDGATWIVKAGMDATHACVVDLVWPAEPPGDGGADLPEATAKLVDVAGYPADPALVARAERHLEAVHALEHATLMRLGAGETLSSLGTRSRQTSVGTLICSTLRDALGADACVFNGGGIRAQHEYTERFTYGDLKAEVPFDNEVVVVAIPGEVLRDAIASSRKSAPLDAGGFLQVDDRIRVDVRDQLVEVAGRPFDPARNYRVALIRNLFEGMDHVEPLVRFAHDHPERIPEATSGRDAKLVLVEAFSRALWLRLGDFDSIDRNHDGRIDAEEIAAAVARVTREPASDITVDLLLKALDRNSDRTVSRDEDDACRALPAGATEPSVP